MRNGNKLLVAFVAATGTTALLGAQCAAETEDEGTSAPNCVVAEACCALAPDQGDQGDPSCVGTDFEGDAWGDQGDLDDAGLDNEDGVLKLKPNTVTRVPVVWVTSTNENMIAKYDSVTGEEVLRKPTWGSFPNRTAVVADGSVWVTNRDSYQFVHIDPNGEIACSTPVMTAGFDADPTFSCYARAAAMDHQGNAWVGCNDSGGLIKFDAAATEGEVEISDPNTGETQTVPRCKELARVDLVDTYPYGLAASSDGSIWVTSLNGPWIAKVNAETLEVAGEFDLTQDAFVQANGACFTPYGMAIDTDGNPWFANWSCFPGTVTKVDGKTGAAIGVFTGGPDGMTNPRAMGLDRRGHLWVANNGSGWVDEFQPDGTWVKRVDVGAGCGLGENSAPGTLGTGSDIDGNMWTVLQYAGKVAKYDTEGNIVGCYPEETPATPLLAGPYTYSDLTGSTNDLVTSTLGRWRGRIDEGEVLDWLLVSYRASVPDGTRVCVRVRGAATAAALDTASWTEQSCHSNPPEQYTVYDIPDSVPNSQFLDVELQLSSRTAGATPAVANLSVGAKRP